jgi:dTMP kinase
MSVLITFEGGDGSGKSTQAALLEQHLSERGYDVVALQEPGSTSLGAYLRDWLKAERPESEALEPVSELLMFLAARAQLVAELVKPALDRPDAVVICDRYIDSTVAYQGYGRGLDVGLIDSLNAIAIDGAVPDLTLLIDVPPEVALGRVNPGSDSSHTATTRDELEGMRRFEEEDAAFHARVHQGYVELAKGEPARWRVVDGTRAAEEVANDVQVLAGEALPDIELEAATERAPVAEEQVAEKQGTKEPVSGNGGDSNQPNLF